MVLDNLVTDRPDNAPPLAGKAFHGVSLMLAAIHGTSFSESMKHANLVYTRCKLSSQMLEQHHKLYLEFFIWFWRRGEGYLRKETEVLLRNSIQIS